MKKHANQTTAGNRNPDNGRSFVSGIGPVLLLTTIFLLNFSARVVYAPLMPEIEKDLGISHSAAGSLFFLISCGYFLSLVGSGWIAANLTHRKTIILSATIVGMALCATALADSLATVRLTLFALGLAAGLYLPSGIATLTALIAPQHWGKALAIHELAPNLAFVAVPLLAELLLLRFPWRAVVLMLGAAAVLIAFLYSRLGLGGRFSGISPSSAAIRAFTVDPAFWIMTLLFGLGISSTLGLFTMLPLYLVNEHGIERNLANSLVAFSRLSGLAMTVAGGWATDRFGPRYTLTVVLLTTGVTTALIGAASGTWLLVCVFLQPLTAVCFFPAGFAALSRIGPPGSRNIAVSLAVPVGFLIGGGAVPMMIGFMGDSFTFALGISIVGGCIAAGALPAYFLKR
ncbi:MAG: MFS transporter [Deltaproteobacteria bacterium]|nr:MFS transporter [Deltaproteobacteria bacterium]